MGRATASGSEAREFVGGHREPPDSDCRLWAGKVMEADSWIHSVLDLLVLNRCVESLELESTDDDKDTSEGQLPHTSLTPHHSPQGPYRTWPRSCS